MPISTPESNASSLQRKKNPSYLMIPLYDTRLHIQEANKRKDTLCPLFLLWDLDTAWFTLIFIHTYFYRHSLFLSFFESLSEWACLLIIHTWRYVLIISCKSVYFLIKKNNFSRMSLFLHFTFSFQFFFSYLVFLFLFNLIIILCFVFYCFDMFFWADHSKFLYIVML